MVGNDWFLRFCIVFVFVLFCVAESCPKPKHNHLIAYYSNLWGVCVWVPDTIPQHKTTQTQIQTQYKTLSKRIKTNRKPIKTNRKPIKTNRQPIKTNRKPIKNNRTPIKTNKVFVKILLLFVNFKSLSFVCAFLMQMMDF